MSSNYNAYKEYILQGTFCERDHEILSAKNDLLSDMEMSPDYHFDTLRNGVSQPFLLTRGGEKHSYNVICRPGDDLFAGDMIDAFGQKWIVMEARADATTHKTGVMYQCNKLFRFQNWTSDIIEKWGYVDVSGYSASFNNDNQLQNSSEQIVIYFPYDTDTERLYVDKRLPSHVGYDNFGNKMLFSFKITGLNPVSESFNCGDHLLMVKAERCLYAQDKDNLDLEICDYIGSEYREEDVIPTVPELAEAPTCSIRGSSGIRIGCARVYNVSLMMPNGSEDTDAEFVWSLNGYHADMEIISNRSVKVRIPDDRILIGDTFKLSATLADDASIYCEIELEVLGIV